MAKQIIIQHSRRCNVAAKDAAVMAECERIENAMWPDSPERKPIEFEHRILGRVDISSCCD